MRPRILDDAKRRQIYALVSTGCSLHTAARHVGCCARTIRREALRDPEFAARLREAEAASHAEPLLASQVKPLLASRRDAKTNWPAAGLHERGDPNPFAPDEPDEPLQDLLQSVDCLLRNAKTVEEVEWVASELAQLVAEMQPDAHSAANPLRDLDASWLNPGPDRSSLSGSSTDLPARSASPATNPPRSQTVEAAAR